MTTESVGEPTCPNLKFVAIVEDESTKQFSCVVEFASIFGETRHIWIKRSDFDDIKILTATLKDRGAELSPDPDVNADAIKSLVASGQSAQKWKVAACTGWRNSSGQYVTRFTTIGDGDPGVRVLPPGTGEDTKASKLGRRGSLRRWQNRVAKPARHSSRMVLGMCAAFAATLLEAAGQSLFGVQISGKTKTAKSTATLAAASVTGFARESDLPNFRTTDAALGELPAEFNDSLFPLNELGLLKGHNRGRQDRMHDLAYGLAEGSGTAYSKHFTQKSKLQWRTIALANSEESAEELAQKAGMTRMGGATTRWIDLPAVRKGRCTIFDMPPVEKFKGDEAAWAKATCIKMRKAIEKNHGVAVYQFIKKILGQRDHVFQDIKAKSQLFMDEVSQKSDSSPVNHLATNFAHIYAGGAIAVELGILPWKERLVLKCIKRCYLDARRTMRTSEDLLGSALKTLLKKINGDALVTIGKKRVAAKSMQKADGYIVSAGMVQKVTVRAEKFKGWFSDARQPRLVLDWLLEHDGIALTGNRKPGAGIAIVWAETQKTWPDGTRARSIVIDLSLNLRTLLPQ